MNMLKQVIIHLVATLLRIQQTSHLSQVCKYKPLPTGAPANRNHPACPTLTINAMCSSISYAHVATTRLSELIHKLLVELGNAAYPFRARREESGPKVQSPLLLSETGTRHNTDTCCVKQAKAVVLIGSLASLLSRLDRLGGQSDGREQVHGALRGLAGDTFHFLESLVEGVGAGVKAVEDVVVFLLVERVRGAAWLRRVDHDLNHALADDGGAEHDGDELVDLRNDLETSKVS